MKTLFSLGLGMLLLAGSSGSVQRVPVSYCPNCYQNTLTKVTTRNYEHDEKFPCTHGNAKWDLYSVYSVKVTDHCSNCGYSKTSNTEEHIYKKCTNG